MELIQTLTSQLGISEAQAKGGSGLLFKMAKEQLRSEEFGKVSRAVPGVGELISAAPASGGMAGALGGLASSFGGGAGQLGALAALAGGFKSLDLDSGMIGRFIPVVLSFVQSKGGDSVKNILAKALS